MLGQYLFVSIVVEEREEHREVAEERKMKGKVSSKLVKVVLDPRIGGIGGYWQLRTNVV